MRANCNVRTGALDLPLYFIQRRHCTRAVDDQNFLIAHLKQPAHRFVTLACQAQILKDECSSYAIIFFSLYTSTCVQQINVIKDVTCGGQISTYSLRNKVYSSTSVFLLNGTQTRSHLVEKGNSRRNEGSL